MATTPTISQYEGKYVTNPATGKIYLVQNGKTYYIRKWSDVGGQKTVSLSNSVVASWPTGGNYPEVSDYEGKYVTNPSNGKVYIVKDGKTYYIAKWSDVGGQKTVSLSNTVVASWPTGGTYIPATVTVAGKATGSEPSTPAGTSAQPIAHSGSIPPPAPLPTNDEPAPAPPSADTSTTVAVQATATSNTGLILAALAAAVLVAIFMLHKK